VRAAAAALAAALIAASTLAHASAGPRRASGSPAAVASRNLSHGDLYDALAVIDGRLVLSGEDPLLVSGEGAASPHSPPRRCHAALVDPATLALWDPGTGDCEDPRLYGLRVLPVNFIANGTASASTVRIARVTRGGGYTVGPVVMRYSEYSDTDAEWVYGDGYLWIYDCLTTTGSVLLRVSQSTGALLQTIRMPDVDRPLLAADGDGLWLAPAANSSFTPSSATGLYRVAPDMSRPVLVRRLPTDTVYWMIAARHTLWVDVNHAGTSQTLLRFDGTATKPAADVRERSGPGFEGVDFGQGQPEYAGDTADGLWTVDPQTADLRSQRVVRIDPTSGRAVTVATVTPPDGYYSDHSSPPTAIVDGSLFFLDPPSTGSYGAPQGPSFLYRLTPG